MTRKVNGDRRSRGHTSGITVSGELAGVEDGKIGFTKVLKFFSSGTDQHVVHEESVVSSSADDTDLDTVLGVRSGISVKDIKTLTSVEVIDGTFTVDHESLSRQLGVDRPPLQNDSSLKEMNILVRRFTMQ